MGYLQILKGYCENYQDIENYELAKTVNFKGWQCHHRLETHNSDGKRRLVDITRKELLALGMYYNRPASELIFMKTKEHRQLHMRDASFSEVTLKKMSEAAKGKKLSEETRKKISEAMRGNQHSKGFHHSEETRKKISNAMKGKKPSEHTLQKAAATHKGKHWKLVDGKRVWY